MQSTPGAFLNPVLRFRHEQAVADAKKESKWVSIPDVMAVEITADDLFDRLMEIDQDENLSAHPSVEGDLRHKAAQRKLVRRRCSCCIMEAAEGLEGA